MATNEEQKKPTKDRDVLLGAERERDQPVRVDSNLGWKILGGFGLLLALVGLADIGLYLYPPAFDSPEWEFGTMAAILSGLPLPTIGFGALTAWAVARGGKKARIAVGALLLVVALLVATAYALFLLDVPIAWTATSGPQGPAIIRAIARSSIMAVGLGAGYLVLAIILLRTSKPRTGR